MVVCWVDRPTTSTEVVVGQSLWDGVDAGKADHYYVVIDADEPFDGDKCAHRSAPSSDPLVPSIEQYWPPVLFGDGMRG